ncbi:hypothetical protein K501DRAFT_329272 [Backusella circina FSU 941]|nr:hypothetical protein K501DRAFT_329272 [Backusella circina FSU 941]
MSHNNLFPQHQQDFNDEAAAAIFATAPPFLQFAPSVLPQQHLNRTRSVETMNFQQNSFQNQDPLMSHPMLFTHFPPTTTTTPSSATVSMDPIFANPMINNSNNNNKQSQSRADRRAEHNALERARRESLNSKFQKLALSLPNLSNDSRPSKNTIIERTLDFVQDAKLKEERMRNQIEELERVNRYLLSQLDNKNASSSSQSVTRRSSCISINSSSMNYSPHIPQLDETENRFPIKLEVSPSPPSSSVPPTISPPSHDKNKFDATAYHAYNQAVMQNLHHTQYDESEDDEDITEINQINPFAFHQQQHQSFPIMPEQLSCHSFIKERHCVRIYIR